MSRYCLDPDPTICFLKRRPLPSHHLPKFIFYVIEAAAFRNVFGIVRHFGENAEICIHRCNCVRNCVQINITALFSRTSLSHLGRIRRYAHQSPTGYLLAILMELSLLGTNLPLPVKENDSLVLGLVIQGPPLPAPVCCSLTSRCGVAFLIFLFKQQP